MSQALLVDPIRDSSLAITVPSEVGRIRTLGDLLAFYRSADLGSLASQGLIDPAQFLDLERFADSVFLLNDDGTLGDLDPGLRFSINGRPSDLDSPLDDVGSDDEPARISIDRTRCRYARSWPAYLTRRWNLRAKVYSKFVTSVVENALGRDAEDVLQLETPSQVRTFIATVARRIHAAPYETYSRYLEPGTPFKSCDQVLDRIIEGDGGICSEKAMALYFIAHAYGIPAELALGGEQASGSFPAGTLRSMLDQASFDFHNTGDTQRYWQHYALLFPLTGTGGDFVFCDVAASNIPFLCLDARGAAPYLHPHRKKPLRVTITLEPLDLFYHRIERRQDIALDLYFAMEHLIDRIDVIQTIDNELGLLHTGDFWVGAFASRNRRERLEIAREYEHFVSQAGRDPAADMCFFSDLDRAYHPMAEQFLNAHPRGAGRISAADEGLQRRLNLSGEELAIDYVILKLKDAHG